MSGVLTQESAEENAMARVVTPKQMKTTINDNVKECVPSVASLFKKAEVSLG